MLLRTVKENSPPLLDSIDFDLTKIVPFNENVVMAVCTLSRKRNLHYKILYFLRKLSSKILFLREGTIVKSEELLIRRP
ncbi:hypothetical protein [Dokdonia sp. Hel_I_53]|uniref:hypothetical protein n=1 Tax=Dokdonia sp. Hel_I_53 TaxID=1566287 RepID=UPI00119DC3AC|nr:hypothetical protein [Dokdonia sp. Hel_I_53]